MQWHQFNSIWKVLSVTFNILISNHTYNSFGHIKLTLLEIKRDSYKIRSFQSPRQRESAAGEDCVNMVDVALDY